MITTTTIVEITDGDGVTGMGAYDSDTFVSWDREPLERLRDILPRLLGRPADDRDAAWALVHLGGTSPFAPAVTSALDTALWDLAARRAGQPLAAFLGAASPETPLAAYASIPLLEDEGAHLELVAQVVADGWPAVKVHGWGDVRRDAGLLERIRADLPDVTLMHDAEGRYDLPGAIGFVDATAGLGLEWLEGPLPDMEIDAYRKLRGRGVPIVAAGDAIWDPRLMAELLRDPPWDAVRFDVAFAGGVTAALRLLRVAATAGLPAELISYGHSVIQATDLHVAVAGGRTTYFEQPVPMEPWEHAVLNPIRHQGGRVRVPDGPGLGIELDRDALDAATVAKIVVP